jgi:hypothetical protein
MRMATKYLMAIMAVCIIAVGLNTASASSEDISDLKKLISVNEDTRMNSQDLAFFLVTHNYSAVPKDGYVNIDVDGKIYKLVPNGDKPGLCDIAF